MPKQKVGQHKTDEWLELQLEVGVSALLEHMRLVDKVIFVNFLKQNLPDLGLKNSFIVFGSIERIHLKL